MKDFQAKGWNYLQIKSPIWKRFTSNMLIANDYELPGTGKQYTRKERHLLNNFHFASNICYWTCCRINDNLQDVIRENAYNCEWKDEVAGTMNKEKFKAQPFPSYGFLPLSSSPVPNEIKFMINRRTESSSICFQKKKKKEKPKIPVKDII